MKQKFGTKIRIITALEKNDIRLLTHLLGRQKHLPDQPVDKLGNNILHVACTLGNVPLVQYIFDTYHLDINAYNTDGMNALHLATCSVELDTIKWLCKKGVDSQSKTLLSHVNSYEIIFGMIKNNACLEKITIMTCDFQKKMHEVKEFLHAMHIKSMRGRKIREFLWCYGKLRNMNQDIGVLPQGMIHEIAEYI